MRDIQIGDIEATRPSDWAIRGVIGGLSVLWGPPGSYKTFLSIGMGVCVAAGRTWFGHQVKEGPVLYVLGEGGLDLFRRRAGEAARHFQVDLKSLPLWVRGEALDLSSPKALYQSGAMAHWDIISPSLIIVDTLSRCLPGDENKQEVMQGFVGCMDLLRDRYQATVLVIHHEGRSGTVRGSTVLPGAVDVSIHVERGTEGTSHTLTLLPDKLRDLDTSSFDCGIMYAETTDVRDSGNRLILDEYGDVVTTVVVQGKKIGDKVKQLLETFRSLKGARGPDAWVAYTEWFGATSLPPTTFKRALSEIIHNPEYGIVSPQRGQYTLGGDFDPTANPLERSFLPGKNPDIEEETERIGDADNAYHDIKAEEEE